MNSFLRYSNVGEGRRESLAFHVRVPFRFTIFDLISSYLAPEYFQHGKVSDKTDVYALGVVLLELVTGRKPIEARTRGEENLVLWVSHYITLIISSTFVGLVILFCTNSYVIEHDYARQLPL